MKVERDKTFVPVFVPIIITLESLNEVSKLYALLNNSKITKALNWEDAWELLAPFTDKEMSGEYHEILEKILTRGRNWRT